jgi:hypothetical protein
LQVVFERKEQNATASLSRILAWLDSKAAEIQIEENRIRNNGGASLFLRARLPIFGGKHRDFKIPATGEMSDELKRQLRTFYPAGNTLSRLRLTVFK